MTNIQRIFWAVLSFGSFIFNYIEPKTLQKIEGFVCCIGLLILGFSIDKKGRLGNLIQEYKEWKLRKNITVGTIWDFDSIEKPEVYSITGYLYELDTKFTKREIKRLVKHKMIGEDELEEIDFYKSCKKIELYPNYQNLRNKLLDSVII